MFATALNNVHSFLQESFRRARCSIPAKEYKNLTSILISSTTVTPHKTPDAITIIHPIVQQIEDRYSYWRAGLRHYLRYQAPTLRCLLSYLTTTPVRTSASVSENISEAVDLKMRGKMSTNGGPHWKEVARELWHELHIRARRPRRATLTVTSHVYQQRPQQAQLSLNDNMIKSRSYTITSSTHGPRKFYWPNTSHQHMSHVNSNHIYLIHLYCFETKNTHPEIHRHTATTITNISSWTPSISPTLIQVTHIELPTFTTLPLTSPLSPLPVSAPQIKHNWHYDVCIINDRYRKLKNCPDKPAISFSANTQPTTLPSPFTVLFTWQIQVELFEVSFVAQKFEEHSCLRRVTRMQMPTIVEQPR